MGIQPELADALRTFRRLAQAHRLTYTITSGYRSLRHQERLYSAYLARGRTGLPAARPGCSLHNFGFAVDAVSRDPDLLVRLMQASGLVWAGRADPVHFGLVGFPQWRQILHEAGAVC